MYYSYGKCDGLTDIALPNSVTVISAYAFCECSQLTSITIPSSVTRIEEATFYKCEKLERISYDGTKAQWNAIEKCDMWDYMSVSYTVVCSDGEIVKG